MRWILLFTFPFLLADFSGQMTSSAPPHHCGNDTLRYFFVGHCYDWQSAGVDPRVEGLNYGRYDRIMLGGDVCSEALFRRRTVVYIDSIFDLGSPYTHYVMGNHDARNENWEWYEEFTGRKTYSTHSEHGLTVFVLNTTINPGDCEDLDAQYRLLESICDTIAASSHLLILQHHGIMQDVPGLPSRILDYANWQIPFWNANCYQENTFYIDAVYPMLVEVQQRGVQVISVVGDGGVREKGRTMETPEGLYYISSGIDNTRYANDSLALDTVPKDKVLIFEHLPATRSLTWEFWDLDSLYNAEN
ncbi:MAG: hypothetical protein AAGN35_02570 [Bacteroidota bacterium]